MRNNIVPFERPLSPYELLLEEQEYILDQIDEEADNIRFAQEGLMSLLGWGYILPVRLGQLSLEEIILVTGHYIRLVTNYVKSWKTSQINELNLRAQLMFLDM